jgi:hypothetical protein
MVPGHRCELPLRAVKADAYSVLHFKSPVGVEFNPQFTYSPCGFNLWKGCSKTSIKCA